MTKEAGSTACRQTQAEAARAIIGALVELNERVLEGAIRCGQAVIEGMAAISDEMFSFLQVRLREDLKTYQALMNRCASPGEVYDCQRQFAERANFQYLELAKELNSVGSWIAGSTWSPPDTGTVVASEKAPPRLRASTRPMAATRIKAVETIAAD